MPDWYGFFLIHYLHISVYFVCSTRYYFSNFSIAVMKYHKQYRKGRVYLGLQLRMGRSPSPPGQGAQRAGRNGTGAAAESSHLVHKQEAEKHTGNGTSLLKPQAYPS